MCAVAMAPRGSRAAASEGGRLCPDDGGGDRRRMALMLLAVSASSCGRPWPRRPDSQRRDGDASEHRPSRGLPAGRGDQGSRAVDRGRRQAHSPVARPCDPHGGGRDEGLCPGVRPEARGLRDDPRRGPPPEPAQVARAALRHSTRRCSPSPSTSPRARSRAGAAGASGWGGSWRGSRSSRSWPSCCGARFIPGPSSACG